MQSVVEEVAENRVRLTVDVPGHDVRHAVEHAASDLAGSVKIPGFRKGRVPLQVLVSRIGRDRLFTEAIESHIGGWFWNAAARTRIRPITQPEFEFELPSSDREDWSFTATVEVQPKPEVADWTQLEVPRVEAEVPEDAIEHELNILRSSVAQLVPVDDRAVEPGDTVVLDLINASGEEQHDYVVEVGSGRLVEEIDQALVGMRSDEMKEVAFELADDAQGTVTFTVREIKEKVLPELDDDFARSASEFDTLEELRGDIERRLHEQLEDEAEAAFRAAAADRLVETSRVDAAGPLVEMRTRELLNGLVRSVESRGVSFDTYLALSGGTAEALVERLGEEARRAVARELILDAAAEKLGIEVPDAEVEQLVREQAAEDGDAEETLAQMREAGAFEQLRSDLRLRAALDRIAAEVRPIPASLAAARDKLWTPEQEKTAADTKLWTPGSKEPA